MPQKRTRPSDVAGVPPAPPNHETAATTSRAARLARSPLSPNLMPAVSFVASVVRANPVPAGLRRRARHESASDTKAFTPVGRFHENASRFYSNEPLQRGEVQSPDNVEAASRRFEMRRSTSFLAADVNVRLEATRRRFHVSCRHVLDVGLSPDGVLRLRERVEDFSCSRREADRFSCRAKRGFVTSARTQPPGRGLARTTAARDEAVRLQSRGDGERANRARRDARALGSWSAPQGADQQNI